MNNEIRSYISAFTNPRPLLNASEWSESYRYLSKEDSKRAILGDTKWSFNGFEYLQGMGEAFSNPFVRKITILKSAQTGFTQMMLNCIAYSIDMNPGPMLVLYPTDTNVAKFAKRKLDPMIRDTPQIRGLVSDSVKRDGNNSLREKTFPGGFISLASAKSVNNLSMQSIMYLFIDELDRIDRIAGNEGDTIEIARKRLQGFKEVSKEINISTPTTKSNSRIYNEYMESDQRKLYLPCPECGQYQLLNFKQLKGWYIEKGVYRPEDVYYECEYCHCHLHDNDKYIMLKEGKWRADNPDQKKHAGFFINELYSTLSSWSDIVDQFCKTKSDPFRLQTFVNLVLGEPFEDQENAVEETSLSKRLEDYDERLLPEGIVYLTAGIDVQKDRIEVAVKGWGRGEESWLVEYKVLHGDTSVPYYDEPIFDVYNKNIENVYYSLEQFLEKKYLHECGVYLRINYAGMDTGYNTETVQRFLKKLYRKGKSWIFALQGDRGVIGAPIINRGSIKNKLKIRQFQVGTSTAKNIIYSRLKIEEFGAGYIHLPKKFADEEYLKQLLAEKFERIYRKGIEIGNKWTKIRSRNEALDCEVYALAALYFQNVNLNALADQMNLRVKPKQEIQDVTQLTIDIPETEKPENIPTLTKRKKHKVRIIRNDYNYVSKY